MRKNTDMADNAADALSAIKISENLKNEYMNMPIYVYNVIDSTNNEAKRLNYNGIKYTLLVSEEQTEGRGRLGRSFYSPRATGIYMSLVCKVDFKAIESPMLITLKAAIAVTRALESLTNLNFGVKWVNDVYYNNKKVAGILAEAIVDSKNGRPDYVVVGIGINTSTKEFPNEIKNKATSIDSAISRNKIVAAIINELVPLYENMYDVSFMDEYRKKSIIIGNKVQYEENGQPAYGIASDIAQNGGLIVMGEDGSLITITSGIVEMNFD